MMNKVDHGKTRLVNPISKAVCQKQVPYGESPDMLFFKSLGSVMRTPSHSPNTDYENYGCPAGAVEPSALKSWGHGSAA